MTNSFKKMVKVKNLALATTLLAGCVANTAWAETQAERDARIASYPSASASPACDSFVNYTKSPTFTYPADYTAAQVAYPASSGLSGTYTTMVLKPENQAKLDAYSVTILAERQQVNARCTNTVVGTAQGLDQTNANLANLDRRMVAGDAATLASANSYTDSAIAKSESKTSSGVAAIAAMASVPPMTAGKNFSVGVGVGSYDGKAALAVAAQKRFSENLTARLSFASGIGSGAKPVVGAGAAWEY